MLEYFNGEREFPNIERQQMIAIVSRALDHDDPNLVYTAISCVKKMLWREERQIRPKITALTKHQDKWIRTEARSALEYVRPKEKTFGEYFIRPPDAGALVPAARAGKPALRAA